MIVLLGLAGCSAVRFERAETDASNEADADVDEPAEGERARDPETSPPRACDQGSIIVHETFAGDEWPAAWLPEEPGESWVERHAGYLLAPVGASHGRTLLRSFGDIDVAIRFVPSASQTFSLELRGHNENKDAIVVRSHATGSEPQWLRARVWNDSVGTHLEVREWAAAEPEPSEWRGWVDHSAAVLGALSLYVQAYAGDAPLRVEEILVCPAVLATDS
jgi:hypothetical protein